MSAEALARWSEILELPRPVRWVARTGSTNADLEAEATRYAHGQALFADEQTAGRGRLGRTWVGSGVTLSVLLKPSLSLAQAPLVCLAGAVAVTDVVPSARIKWPNDVVDDEGRKLGGLLAQVDGRAGRIGWLVLGCGLNLEAPDLPGAGALAWTGSREELAVRWVRAVLARVDALERVPAVVLADWRSRSHTLGRRVRVGTVEGEAVGLGDDGALEVQTDEGIRRVLAGDVEMVAGPGMRSDQGDR